jgi:hypothetical protein
MTAHAIVHGNAHLSQCSCGERIPSCAGAIEYHMYPLTAVERMMLDNADPEAVS